MHRVGMERRGDLELPQGATSQHLDVFTNPDALKASESSAELNL